MAIYEVTKNSFRIIQESTFADLKIQERADIQRLLRAQIEVIGDDLYVLDEEFGEWEDSKRRIDLLALDKKANIVVVEIKRTIDGGHMELQAVRYASMVSAMTFPRAVQIHREYLARVGEASVDPEKRILDFLEWDEPDEESFAADTRIVLVSADFSKELTTAVLWLREHDVDIRCVRIKPYSDGDKKLIDVQQIIPLPEANDYQIQIREKEQRERTERSERFAIRGKFWRGLIAIARAKRTRHANISPGEYHWLGASSGIRGLNFNYVIVQSHGIVELYIDRGEATENKTIFDRIVGQKLQVEERFGGTLSWERLNDKRACRVKHTIDSGGYRSPETEWAKVQEAMVEAMIRLEAALRPALDTLKL